MKFQHTLLESIAGAMPPEVWTSADIEARLAPVYERLKLPAGRLELMTGIRERRFWSEGTLPSQASAEAGKAALARANIKPGEVDLLIHAAVCRDRLEPATAAYVHRHLNMEARTQVMDLSNACLGFLNAMTVAGAMIDSGLIRRALIVSGENGRPLLENTLRRLEDPALTRKTIKPFFANLTIGSGAVAATLAHESVARNPVARLLCGASGTDSSANQLCEGESVDAGGLNMQTDSERLMEAGVGLARRVWADFKAVSGWDESTPDRVICHQVGIQHLRLLYQELGLDLCKDYSTFERYGNTGSVALPVTLVEAIEAGEIQPGNHVALLGIGSGLSSLMLAIQLTS